MLGVLRSEDGVVDPDLRPAPRSADIARLVEESRTAGLGVELEGPVPELPDAVARAVYRLVQEGLTNVHKHAGGAGALVSVRGDGSTASASRS